MRRTTIRAAVLVALALVAVAVPGAARAAPPANDDFANATVVDPSALPFTSDPVTIDEATLESGEPASCYWSNSQTVWYAITPPSDGALRVSQSTSFYYQFAAVYEQSGVGFGGLGALGCATWWYGTSSVTVPVKAGKTYYVQAGSNFFVSGTMSVSVQLILPPTNDDFAKASAIGSLPYSDTADTTAATTEAAESVPSCSFSGDTGTVWYRYTPAADGWVSASVPYATAPPVYAAYSGTSLGSLTELGCRTWSGLVTLRVQAGRTYYFQIGGLYGDRGTLRFNLDVAPNPVASLGFSPGDPSIFDSMQFSDLSSDPGEVGIQSRSWSFGDASTSTDQNPQHRYAADGDYSVKLTVTTTDGRTATTTQVVHVRTHDVTITKVTTPQTASVGQTRQITVGLTNGRYPETVQVQLYKSVAGGGWQPVGTSTQTVPVRGANRTTSFVFNYTFAPEDKTLGKVTFQAVATIQGTRDAIPTDNTFISLPTKVN